MRLSLVSVNVFNLYQSAEAQARYADVEELIAGLGADVVAVQEITAGGAGKIDAAASGVRRLAQATAMECEIDGEVAVAVGGGQHHTALLWRGGIEPVHGTAAKFDRDRAGLWHSLLTAVLDVGGPKLRVGSVQLSPFDQEWGRRDAHQVLRAMHGDAIPGVVGGDFNGVGADPAYDPDPYQDVAWHPDQVYQLADDGAVDRRVAIRLETVGRLRDCAALTASPWQATSGHWPGRHHPPRRIDRWYATYHLPSAAVAGFQVVDTPQARACSDHLPVVITLETAALAEAG